MLKKIPKTVWYQNEKWHVHTILSPTKFDDYLVLQQTDSHGMHEDGKTSPVLMILIDAHNDEFYPGTPSVNAIMKKLAQVEAEYQRQQEIEKAILTNAWLNCFPE